jgi:hypothetical protein
MLETADSSLGPILEAVAGAAASARVDMRKALLVEAAESIPAVHPVVLFGPIEEEQLPSTTIKRVRAAEDEEEAAACSQPKKNKPADEN